MKFLLTGFEPFGGESMNPALEAVMQLPDHVATVSIIKSPLPVVYGMAGEQLAALVREHQPKAVICVGQAGGRSVVSVERVAINLRDADGADNAGVRYEDSPIAADGPAAYFSTLPVKAIVSRIREAGIPANVSDSAGTYVCNDVFYQLRRLLEREYPDVMGGFIHVPFAMEQVVNKRDGLPYMSLEAIAAALRCAVEAVADQITQEKG